MGKRTDIRIDALRRNDRGDGYDVLTAIIETKGCWNPDLLSALEVQLYRDYMVPIGAPAGIYLVGWFDKDKWDPNDGRRRRTPDRAIDDIVAELNAQAAGLPQGFAVRPVVIDCHAP